MQPSSNTNIITQDDIDFLNTLAQQMDKRVDLTPEQEAKLKEIFSKHAETLRSRIEPWSDAENKQEGLKFFISGSRKSEKAFCN